MKVFNCEKVKHTSSYGLLYRYANKSRRKVPSVIFILLPMLLLSLPCDVCAGDERIIRVDPLGMSLDFNPYYRINLFVLQTRLKLILIFVLLEFTTTKKYFLLFSLFVVTLNAISVWFEYKISNLSRKRALILAFQINPLCEITRIKFSNSTLT